ncbi:uncharacterized protein LDX57_009912 [Aspergillus melleus]|uniref:uncharacterized protein n=1 Tax=Aspergillus melleus TaxID=138277 RepID=UPI001E8CBC24|nr:uncharacterized protein LDX57_009912 [Aspergillus melleus]KAH8432273.1 hypothetical protein LDX57_009912 [Aspergillus melleus]
MDLFYFPTGKICPVSVGSYMNINGRNVLITRALSEKSQPNMNERWAVFEGQVTTTGKVVILKIRYQ